MNSLNAMWFYKMARGALRVLAGPGAKRGQSRKASNMELSDR